MARYKNGINGPVNGKVGNVVAVSWRGIDYFRSLPEQAGKVPSQAQLDHREVFGMVSSWLKPLKELIGIGFRYVTLGKTPMNEAISFIFKEALVIEDGEKKIDFSKAVFSRGELLISIILEVIALVEGLIHIIWSDVNPSAFNKDTDRATFILYNPQKEKFANFRDVALRGDKEVMLQLPDGFEGDQLHGYMQYSNEQGDLVSTTVYLGNINPLIL